LRNDLRREISQAALPFEASTAGIYVVVHGRPDPDKLQHFMEEGMRVLEELTTRQSRSDGQSA